MRALPITPAIPLMVLRLALVLWLGSALGSPLVAQEGGASSTIEELRAVQTEVSERVEKCLQATVALEMGNGMGTGVIINETGLILTAAHVYGRPGRELTVVLPDGTRLAGKTLGRDTRNDAGMVQIIRKGTYDFVPVANEKMPPETGDWCFALGHPGGFEKERGGVLRVGRVVRSAKRSLHTDCELIGGDSGGPLFNLKGEVIGIHTSITPDTDDNFHVGIPVYRENWAKLEAGETIESPLMARGGFLGIRSIWRDNGQQIQRVSENSPAHSAGLQVGDVIVGISDGTLEHARDFQRKMRETKAGEEVVVEVLRKGKLEKLKVTLGSWPSKIEE